MNDPLSRRIADAFPADGEAPPLTRRPKGNTSMTRRRMVTALSALLVLVSAGAVAAKVAMDRYFLVQNGQPIGEVSATQNGQATIYTVDGDHLPKDGSNVEIRSESGKKVGDIQASGGNISVQMDGAASGVVTTHTVTFPDPPKKP